MSNFLNDLKYSSFENQVTSELNLVFNQIADAKCCFWRYRPKFNTKLTCISLIQFCFVKFSEFKSLRRAFLPLEPGPWCDLANKKNRLEFIDVSEKFCIKFLHVQLWRVKNVAAVEHSWFSHQVKSNHSFDLQRMR